MASRRASWLSPFGRRVMGGFLSVSLGLPLAFSAVACGGGQTQEANSGRAQVKAGDMPAGADWTGVYFSPLYGYLHLTKGGNVMNGVWRTTAGDAWGEMHGEVMGDLYRFEWTEHKIGLVGPSATSRGKGYFKYSSSGSDSDEDKIVGEWGLGNDEAGNPWDAVKQRNMLPNPESVRPNELEQPDEKGWD